MPGTANVNPPATMIAISVRLVIFFLKKIDFNFKISAGEFIYIIGKTGSGKSSLLKSLYAELSVNKGEVKVLDFDVSNLDDNGISSLRKKLGIVFQDFQLLTDRNVYDNLLFVLQSTGWTEKEKMEKRINC